MKEQAGVQVTRFYCKYFDLDIYVDFNYYPRTDEEDSEIELFRVWYYIGYSMGVGHEIDYSDLFFHCPEFKETFAQFILELYEKKNEL